MVRFLYITYHSGVDPHVLIGSDSVGSDSKSKVRAQHNKPLCYLYFTYFLTSFVPFVCLFVCFFFRGKEQVWSHKDIIGTLELCALLLFCFETDATVSCDTLGPLRDLVFGAWDEVPADCAKNRGGGWCNDNNSAECAVHSNLEGIYPLFGKETLAAIHWRNLDSTSAERSAPTSTEIKIRPVEFMRVAWSLHLWYVHLLNQCCFRKNRK